MTDSLHDVVAQSLPAGLLYKYNYIVTPFATGPPLFAAPPGLQRERTHSASHLLLVSRRIGHEDGHCAIFAIELIIYTTAHLTTLFVSKVDSTGLVPQTKDGETATTPLRPLASAYIAWAVRRHHHPAKKLVLSLFARAQNQYLFPGSIEHGKKHVLDDRGLVKWWCRTLDPVLREYVPKDDIETRDTEPQICARAYLLVPGHDKNETSAFFPSSAKSDATNHKGWNHGHPLYDISSHPNAPPRCLVPRFPDDPKARFVLDLDEELPDASVAGKNPDSSYKRADDIWNSVKTLEQFWEMMGFRQECSSGRLVGFIWVVFTPGERIGLGDKLSSSSSSSVKTKESSSPLKSRSLTESQKRKRLRGIIETRQPHSKMSRKGSRDRAGGLGATDKHDDTQPDAPLMVNQKVYDRIMEILLRLDFADIETGCSSTSKWATESAILAGKSNHRWSREIVGKLPRRALPSSDGHESGRGWTAESAAVSAAGPAVNVLGASIVRKGKKPGV